MEPADDPLPQFIDWLGAGVLTPIRSQGRCSACWAMVVTAAIEALYRINNANEELIQLSPQYLVNCCRPTRTTCYTFSNNGAFRWIRDYGGVCREVDCPYIGEKQECPTHREGWMMRPIRDYFTIPDEDEVGVHTRLVQQPVAAAIHVSPEFANYANGIYEGPLDPTSRPLGLHAVLIVGSGVEVATGREYWIIRNSWGEDWGMGGYGRVLKNSFANQMLLCRFSYPVL